MKFTLLGTGTSQGVPVVTCKCQVCLSVDNKDKRLRSSILIESKNTTVVIDAGPDFRTQMLFSKVDRLNAVLLTHAHHDHVSGLDDVRAYNYRQQMSIPVYGNQTCLEQIQRYFSYAFEEDKYPGVPDFHLFEVSKNKFLVGDIEFTPIPVLHGTIEILGFKAGTMAYITDASSIPKSSIKELYGLKVLVINALRWEPHHSHFCFSEVFEIVKTLQPEMTYLTHISHTAGKHKQLLKDMPEGIRPGYDGLIVQL